MIWMAIIWLVAGVFAAVLFGLAARRTQEPAELIEHKHATTSSSAQG